MVSNVTVDVAANGTLAFGEAGENLIVNGDFKRPVAVASNGIFDWDRTTLESWTLTRGEGTTGNSGVQKNGSVMSQNGGYQTPCGNQTLYIRGGSSGEQSVSVREDGTYRLSFLQSFRKYEGCYNLKLTVTVDDAPVMTIGPSTAYYDFTRFTTDIPLTSGTHVIKFSTSGNLANGAMMFFDDVSLRKVLGQPTFANSLIRLARGSTLDLQNTQEIILEKDSVLVDGVPVFGGRSALKASGVNVTGPGKIVVGGHAGGVILLR